MQKISGIFQKFPRLTALIAGFVSATGFAPWGLWPLTLICFALLIHLTANAGTGKRAFMLGWLFGVGHFTFSNQWIAVAFTFQAAMPIWLGYVAVVALALYLAVYPAMAAWGAWWIANRLEPPRNGEGDHAKHRGGIRAGSPDIEAAGYPAGTPLPPSAVSLPVQGRITLPLILAFAGLWIVTEWLRSWVFTGYVWNPLSVITVPFPFIAQPASAVGTYGLSGLILLVVGGAIKFLSLWTRATAEERKGNGWTGYFAGGLLLFALVATALVLRLSLFSGYYRSPAPKEPVALTIVQPNISQADKYAPGYDAINFAKLAMNSRPLADQGPRLLLWPEAAIPDYLEDGYPYRYYQFQPGESAAGARQRLTTLMGEGDVLITGANRLVIDKGQLVAARNSVSAMDSTGKLLGHYDKAHLVPYGEYLPLPWLLRPLGLARLVPGDLDFWPGPGPQTLTVKVGDRQVKVGMQICYEIIFSGQTVDRKNRPDFIFNPSNDAWFGRIGPPQHLAQARLRAIEEGLPVIRATPTGISAVIDADGRIVKSLPLGKAGRIETRLPHAHAPTLFARYGNILPLGFAALLIAFALLPLARARASR
ncbi:MAG: apolipoprotein N-acyltransferase [Sphingomonadaceae bacterium]|nr:apolipoprotein N-acyltransferase [Sphingomonadaceae bacterium]